MKILESVLFLTLIFGEGVFYYVNYKILWLNLSKSVIISKELACFTKGYFMIVWREKWLVPLGVKIDLHTSPLHINKPIPKLKSMCMGVDLGFLSCYVLLNGCVCRNVSLCFVKLEMNECF